MNGRASPAIRRASLPWALPAVAAYFAVLARLLVDAPAMDDYDAILGSAMRMQDAPSVREWFAWLLSLHNEHRISITRLVAWTTAEVFGRIDFRVLLLLGNLQLVGILLLAWSLFRERLHPAFLAAAGFVLLQLSYYEAALMTMASISNLGVVLAAFACLLCALRDFRGATAACIALGIVAGLSQGNGIFALPLAAGACLVAGRRRRALLVAIAAAILWVLYFQGYSRPGHHPSPWLAFERPLEAAHLFLVVIGGIVPGERSVYAGATIIAGLAALTLTGFWRRYPVVGLWVLFLLGSAAAATAARLGFGIHYASRYAVNSSCLAMLILLGAGTHVPRPPRALLVAVVAAAAIFSGWVTSRTWKAASEYALENRMLVRVETPGGASRYDGFHYPVPHIPAPLLAQAEQRGLYRARRMTLRDYDVQAVEALPQAARRAGFIDEVVVEGPELRVRGWTDFAASDERNRLMLRAPQPASLAVERLHRIDVARRRKDVRLQHSGFLVTAAYASEQEARSAADGLCVAAESSQGVSLLLGGACGTSPEAR